MFHLENGKPLRLQVQMSPALTVTAEDKIQIEGFGSNGPTDVRLS